MFACDSAERVTPRRGSRHPSNACIRRHVHGRQLSYDIVLGGCAAAVVLGWVAYRWALCRAGCTGADRDTVGGASKASERMVLTQCPRGRPAQWSGNAA